MKYVIIIIVLLYCNSCYESHDNGKNESQEHYFIFYNSYLSVDGNDSLRDYFFKNVAFTEKNTQNISLERIRSLILKNAMDIPTLRVSNLNQFKNFSSFIVDTFDYKYPYCIIQKNKIDSLPSARNKTIGKYSRILSLEYALDSTLRKKRKIWGMLDMKPSLGLTITWTSKPMLIKRICYKNKEIVSRPHYYSWNINAYTDTIWTNIDEKVIREWYPHFKGVYIKHNYDEISIDYGKYPDSLDVFKTIELVESKN